jgi:hypothetical protein
MIGRYQQMTGTAHGVATNRPVVSDDVAGLTRQVEQLKEERDYLLAHSQNLEVELRRVAREPGRVRDLEQRLADAESRLRQVSVVHTGKWLVLRPDAALRRIYRMLRDGVGWRLLERYRRYRLKRRPAKA